MPVRHPSGRRLLRQAAGLCAVLFLAACASDAPPPPCPTPAPLSDAARLVSFQGEGRDLTDTRYEARIEDVAVACEYDEEDGRRVVEAEMKVLFGVEKGPAAQSDTVDFTYFVAVADREDNILRRREFPLSLTVSGNQTRLRAVDTLSPTIPLKDGESGADYRLYVGFVLSEAQLRYNRRNPL